jgi:hypothetical protein
MKVVTHPATRFKMNGGIPPIPYRPSRLKQGQLHIYDVYVNWPDAEQI